MNTYPVPKNKEAWRPSASIETLQRRAGILKTIRDFFSARHVLEVETPVLSHASVTDPYIQSIATHCPHAYLQTSPEYAMKRLLAAGSGSIYQITKSFRQDEVGRFHNPEFTMLEWYRPGFDHHALMDEMDLLLQAILKTPASERITYADLFQQHLEIDVHRTSLAALAACAESQGITMVGDISDCDTWLGILLSHLIEPELGKDRPVFIYDYPASQASLSKVRGTNPPLASRFEVYFKGLELANGWHELQDAKEQERRFENNLSERLRQDLPPVPIDELLLGALAHGLPDCAGVALGIDRLIMLALGKEHIADVISFDFERA